MGLSRYYKIEEEEVTKMFCVVEYKENCRQVIKGGFKTASQAHNWCKKHLPRDKTRFWHQPPLPYGELKYAVLNWKPSC